MTDIAKLVDFYDELSKMYMKLNQVHKANTFIRARDIVKDMGDNFDILSFSEFTGIGKSTINEAKQFLVTGTSERYQDLLTKVSVSSMDLAQFLEALKKERYPASNFLILKAQLKLSSFEDVVECIDKIREKDSTLADIIEKYK